MDADIFISLTHFKGHEMHWLWRRFEKHRHGLRQPGGQNGHAPGRASPRWTRSCAVAATLAPRIARNSAITFDEDRKAHINHDNCVGCGRCIGACNFDAISNTNGSALTTI